MNNKDINKLLIAYQDKVAKATPGYYKNQEAFLADHLDVHQEYCYGKTIAEQIDVWMMLIRNPLHLGIYESFMQNDMEMLHNTLYQSALINYMKNIWSSGTDHSLYAFHVMPDLLAADYVSYIPLLMPKEYGLSTTGHTVGITVINLFLALWYNDETFAESARERAEKSLKQKLVQKDIAYISYLLALLDKDCEAASQWLAQICKGKKRSSEFGENQFTKSFCLEAHGMYNLTHYIYNGELDGKIAMPEESNFCKDLATYQSNNRHSDRKLYIEYPDPISILNKMLSITPPTHGIYEEKKGNRKAQFLQFEAFRINYANAVISSLLSSGSTPQTANLHLIKLDKFINALGTVVEKGVFFANADKSYSLALSVIADTDESVQNIVTLLMNKYAVEPTDFMIKSGAYGKRWMAIELKSTHKDEEKAKQSILALAQAIKSSSC